MLKIYQLIKVIESFLENRTLSDMLEENKCPRIRQNNRLPQSWALSILLFNFFWNEQPTLKNIEHFIYAKNLLLYPKT